MKASDAVELLKHNLLGFCTEDLRKYIFTATAQDAYELLKLIERQAKVVEAAREVVKNYNGYKGCQCGAKELTQALAELDHE